MDVKNLFQRLQSIFCVCKDCKEPVTFLQFIIQFKREYALRNGIHDPKCQEIKCGHQDQYANLHVVHVKALEVAHNERCKGIIRRVPGGSIEEIAVAIEKIPPTIVIN